MDDHSGGQQGNIVAVTRRKIFHILKTKMWLDLDDQINEVQTQLSKEGQSPYHFHPDAKNKLKAMLSKLKTKWQGSNRTEIRFLAKNELWLDYIENIPLYDIENVDRQEEISSRSRASKPQEGVTKKMGRHSLPFRDSSERSKRRKTEDLRVTRSTSELAYATQMSLRSAGSKHAASVVKDVAFGSPARATKYKEGYKSAQLPRPFEASGETALSVLVEAKLSRNQYTIIRQGELKNGSPFLPSYDKLIEAKKKCYPSDISVTETSAEVKLQSLLDHTSRRILELQENVIATLSQPVLENLQLVVKWGFDGSSGQSEYKQNFSDEDHSDSHVFLTSLVPLQLLGKHPASQQELIVWKNPRPSSPRFCRPIRLQFLRENVESSINEKNYIDGQIEALVPFEFHCEEKRVIINFKMVMTMIDGKVCNAVTMTSSAIRCYLCRATSKKFNDIDFVLQKPIDETRLDYGLSSLHAWIRFFECLLHLGYRLDLQKWKAHKSEYADRKKAIQTAFQARLGLLIDRPKTGGAGSTNDGNTARRFFENYETSADIIGVDVELIRRFYVILQVLACSFPIAIEKFEKYSLQTARLFVEKYPWCYMPTTVHKVLIHGSVIVNRAVLPIGQLSEEAQESRNKDIKNYRKNYARKSSREKTMNDVFCRLLISSDPLISSLRKTPPKVSRSLSSDAMQLLEPIQIPSRSDDNLYIEPDHIVDENLGENFVRDDAEDVELFDV